MSSTIEVMVRELAVSSREQTITQLEKIMHPMVLDECRELFRDNAGYEQFVTWFVEKLGRDFAPVIAGKNVLGSVLSREATKEILYDRMIQRIAESPKILEDILDRLENDEIVD